LEINNCTGGCGFHLEEDDVVLGKPQAGKLAVDPREDVGDAIPVALSVRRALATPLKKK
jgi:hypothetical protein